MRTLSLSLILLALTACQASTQTQQAAQRLSPVRSAQAAERPAEATADSAVLSLKNALPTFRDPPIVPGWEGKVTVGPLEPVL